MPYYLIAFLFLSSCVSVDISRLLEARYCPQALVLKGAEIKHAGASSIELGQLAVSCKFSTSGEIGTSAFTLNRVNLTIGVWIKHTQADDDALPPARVLVRIIDRASNGVIKRYPVVIETEGSWRKKNVEVSLNPAAFPKRLGSYRVLVALAPIGSTAKRKLDSLHRRLYNGDDSIPREKNG